MNKPENEVEELILRVLYDCHTSLSHEDIKTEVDQVLSVLYHAILRVAVRAAQVGVFTPLEGDSDSVDSDEILDEIRRRREAQQKS